MKQFIRRALAYLQVLVKPAPRPAARLVFDFEGAAVQELDEVKAGLGLAERTDVIRSALGFLQWTVQARKEGWRLAIEQNGERRELVFPWEKSAPERNDA